MNLTRLQINNFRCFRDADIHFKPITLLTGANSSGKSTLLYSFLSCIQTTEPNNYPFELAPNGEYCELGSFLDIVFGRNKDNSIKINLELNDNNEFLKIDSEFYYSRTHERITSKRLSMQSLNSKIEISKISNNKFNITAYIEEPRADEKNIIDLTSSLMNQMISDKKELKQAKKHLQVKYGKFSYTLNKSILRSDDVQSTLVDKGGVNAFTRYLFMRSTLKSINNKFSFSGPARHYPDRVTSDSAGAYRRVGRAGENYIALLAHWKSEKSSKYREVSKLLRELGLINRLQTKRLKEGLLRLSVKVNADSPFVNIQDAGYGISQILPIVVADVDLEKNGTLLISQPELHLHPSCQADLANYFLSRYEDKRRYIIETHSEYLLHRFRVLVSKNLMPSEDIVIYHMVPHKDTFKPIKITITDDGRLKNAPKDFFNTYIQDTFELALGK